MTDFEDEYEVHAPQSANNRRNVMTRKSIFDETALTSAFVDNKINISHIPNIWRMLIQQNLDFENIGSIPNLPKDACKLIKEKFAITSTIIGEQLSKDQSTTKLLIELHDGRKIETVIMRYGAVPLASFPKELLKQKTADNDEEQIAASKFEFKSGRRATVCVSSQVGCNMGCTFCATGTMGLISSLTCGEILEQLYHANRVERIRNVVFMGMGEPLANYDEVLLAIKGMTDVRRFNLAPARISVSTVGVVNRLRTLATDAPGVSLALSLHAPNQTLRSEIVPSSKAYPLDRIIKAVDIFLRNSKRNSKNKDRLFVLVEYVLIEDVNDSDETAHELGKLLSENVDQWMLNVIPYNPTDVPHDYKSPTLEGKMRFLDIVKSYGVRTVVRQELGQDVAAACGQLVVKHERKLKKKLEEESCNCAIYSAFQSAKQTWDSLAPSTQIGIGCGVGMIMSAVLFQVASVIIRKHN